MKNLSRCTAPRQDQTRNPVPHPSENRDLDWDRRPAPEEDADCPRIDPPDRLPFTRDAADRWLR